MRVLLDENLDRRLNRHFDSEHEVLTITECGWSGKKNGELLRLAEVEFDALVTMDRGIEYQQNLKTLRLGIVLRRILSLRRTSRRGCERKQPNIGCTDRPARSRVRSRRQGCGQC